MKKYFILYVILMLISASSICMDVSLLDIDPKVALNLLKDTYDKNQKKFVRYKLDNPKSAVSHLQQLLEKEKDPIKYLQNLQLLASALLIQHLSMKINSIIEFLVGKNLTIMDEALQLKRKLTKQRNITIDSKIDLEPDNDTQATEVLAHHNLLDVQSNMLIHFLNKEEMNVALSWAVDSNKGAWINTAGKYILAKHIMSSIIQKKDTAKKEWEELIFNAITPILSSFTSTAFVMDNIYYLIELLKLDMDYTARIVPNPVGISPLDLAFTKLSTEIVNHYLKNQSSFIKLYEIILKELRETSRQLIIAGHKDIAQHLLPLPPSARTANVLPPKFPDHLDTINPEKEVALPSLAERLKKARVEWEQTQAQSPTKKKYVRRRKITPITTEAAPLKATAEPGEVTPIKIRTATDGSYITEDGEDDIQIIIEDPKNDATITLFKTKINPANAARLKNLPPKNYTPNVQQWFDNPKKARVDQGHTDPNSPKHRAGEPEWKPIVLHAFSRLVDDYLYQYGTVGEINSRSEKDKKDILITVPGKLEYPDGNEETGVFAYIINSATGQWYHRMFTPHSSKKLLADLFEKGYFAPEMTGYYDVFFPALPKK